MTTTNVTIRPASVVPYPDNDLKELKELVDMDGSLINIKDNTGVTPPTVRRILRDGKGQYAKVMALRDFVKKFNTAVRA